MAHDDTHDGMGAAEAQDLLVADPQAAPMQGAGPGVPPTPPTPYPPQPPSNAQGPYPPQGYVPLQGYYPPPGYFPPLGRPVQPPQPDHEVLAIVGFALAFVLPPVGVIISIIALVRAKISGAWRDKGSTRGLAIGGVVAGTIVSLLAIAVLSAVLDRRRDVAEVRSAFEQFEHSLVDLDCDAYMGSTTPIFRQELGAAECDQFAEVVVAAGAGAVKLREVPITGVAIHGDSATVRTIENLGVNWLGGPTIEPLEYTFLRSGGDWLLDDVALAD